MTEENWGHLHALTFASLSHSSVAVSTFKVFINAYLHFEHVVRDGIGIFFKCSSMGIQSIRETGNSSLSKDLNCHVIVHI